jgi:small subunit ribosomal protein S1
VSDSEDFAALFEASYRTKKFERGQTIEGRIVSIGHDVALVDVGGKGEAAIDLAEFKNDDGVLEVAVGDRIQAVVTSTAGGLTLSRRLARGAATARQLEDAFHARLPVQGRVEKAVKGGYEVRIAGQRAFCPVSQIDAPRAEAVPYEGRTYTFRIIEYKENGRNIVVSRRALIEEEQRVAAAELRKTLVPGAVINGRVASVREFGAFVDLGAGVHGLLHVSEMGWTRVTDISQVVTPGQAITVKVLRVDEDGQKIALGLKQLTEDPWIGAAEKYAVGQVIAGRITRILEFGTFIEIEPGVEALAHVSTFGAGNRSNEWAAGLTVGMTGVYEIVSIDLAQKRIGVAPVPEGSPRAARFERAAEGDSAEPPAADEAPERLGSLADKLRAALKPRDQ